MKKLRPKKKQRSRRFRQRRRRRMPINVAASLITTFALYCGIASIFAGMRGAYDQAAYWILAAIIADMLDGTVARMTKSVSDFGKELDSLSDIVSFGVAPAALIYQTFLLKAEPEGPISAPFGAMVAIIFVISGALRLARYNVYQSERQDIFVGLPIPAAAGTIASFMLFYFELRFAHWMLAPLAITLALLMVSTVRYPKKTMGAFVLGPRKAFRFLVLCVVGIAAFNYALEYSPAIVLLPLALAYVLFGVVNETFVFLGRRQATGGETPSGASDNESRDEGTPSTTP